MSNINDIIVQDVLKITEINYEPVEHVNYFTKKYQPINVDSEIPLHKFWLLSEKCKVIKVYKNNIEVALSSKNKFVSDKVLLENKIRTHFEKNTITLCSENTYKFIYDESSTFFNENDVEEKISIRNGDEFDLILELSEIEVCNKFINFIWRIIQMKKIKMVNLKKSLFALKPIERVQQPIYHTQPMQQHIQSQQTKQPTQPKQSVQSKPISFMPSANDLQNALSKLKKSNKDDEIEQENKLRIILPKNIPQLKHVVTKENNIIDLFKQEHKEKIKKDIQNDYVKMCNIHNKMLDKFEDLKYNIHEGLQLLKRLDTLSHYGGISGDS
jgi:hypothetical protein